MRWSQLGFGKTSSTTPDAQTPRNLFGFKDGTRNVSGTDTAGLDRHVWAAQQPGAAWMAGGSYLVARRIRMNIETWDRTSLQAREILGGTLSILSVGLVTWMVFWMRRTARHLKSELHDRLDAALALGTGALAATALFAVGREGLETSLFIWTAVQAGGDGVRPLVGALLGLATSVVLGWLFYKGTLRINLAKFFRRTGAMLVLVAAGVLAYGIHDLQKGDVLPGLRPLAFDISGTVPPDSWYGTLLKGVFNFQPDPTVLQVIVWLLYLVPVMAVFLAPQRTAPPADAPRPASRLSTD